MLKVRTDKQYRSGMYVALEGKVYKVKSSIDLKWLGLGDGYCTMLEYQRLEEKIQ